MKWVKRIVLSIIILVAITILGSWIYLKSIQPDYNETTTLPGLNNITEVYYDNYGVPHIYARSDADAYYALGYTHAKDRLWQMELIRRIAPGRLSEILGEATIKTDKFFKHLQIDKTTALAVSKYNSTIDPAIKSKVDNYLKGINEYVKNDDTPIEFKILGIPKTPFDITDVYNVMGYMAFSFAMAHKTEPIVTHISQILGPDYMKDLDIQVDTTTEMIPSFSAAIDLKDLSLSVYDALKDLPSPQLIGSNSWVIAPSKSTTGKVLFCNDPHIGFAQPSVWYEAHIETPTTSMYGNYLAGFPFAQMGHTRHHAIGLTMFENDDIDFFAEKTDAQHPNQYYHKGEWKPMELRTVTLKVKGLPDQEIELRSTEHGPIVTPEIKEFNPDAAISLWWVYQQNPINLLEAGHILMNAQNIDEARFGASMIAAPGLNIMYGDSEGNIAWWASAKLPIRPNHVNSKMILNGTGEDDPLGYYDFKDNPQSINPPTGYVYSANNQSYKQKDILHPGYYLSEDRARRIVNLLENKDNWSVDDAKAMLLDHTSINASEIAQLFCTYIDQVPLESWPENLQSMVQQSSKNLKSWSGDYSNDSPAPIIFTKLMYITLKNMMSDELGPELFESYNGTHLMKRSNQKMISNAASIWWDNRYTEEQESPTDILYFSLIESLNQLSQQLGTDMTTWKWSSVHTIEHGHTMGQNPTLRKYFNVGPMEIVGGTETINNLMYHLDSTGIYEVTAGPSCRRIVDFNNIMNNSWSILPTGQSGRIMSPHYKDQALMYVRGEYRKKLMDETAIKEGAINKSVFNP